MDLGVMIEGQEGLSWDLWRRFATSVEELGFESLWRSDHFFSLSGPRTQDAVETYLSFAVAAEITKRVRFGALVSAITFRHPSLLARMCAQIDALSGAGSSPVSARAGTSLSTRRLESRFRRSESAWTGSTSRFGS